MNCRRVLVFLLDNDLKKEPTIETNMIQRLRRCELCTGCPNKHGNSVMNSISSFQIIL